MSDESKEIMDSTARIQQSETRRFRFAMLILFLSWCGFITACITGNGVASFFFGLGMLFATIYIARTVHS